MLWKLTEEQSLICERVKDFFKRSDNRIKKLIRASEETHEFQPEIVSLLNEMGFLGMNVPEEFGGSGLDYFTSIPIIELISYYWGVLGLFTIVQNSLTEFPINAFGTQKQKGKYLPRLATGEWVGCYLQTEPDHGSDAIFMETRAEKKEDRWLVHGSKAFITNGSIAKVGILFARTSKEERGKEGITAFIADLGENVPGCEIIRKNENKMGLQGLTLSVLGFDGFEIPDENVLGEIGQGWMTIAKTVLSHSRICIAAQALGMGRRAFDEAVSYANTRKQFGKKIIEFSEVSSRLAELKTELDATELLIYAAAQAESDNRPDWHILSSEAKLKAAELAFVAARGCQLTFGGAGFLEDYIAARLLRDASVLSIYEGTDDIQKRIIASSLKNK